MSYNKCEHGRLKNQCKTCGGSYICPHGKLKNQCKIAVAVIFANMEN
jgi:hypothetical protein